jgi:tetratricopeptide (TPR) repeat protein
MMKKGFLGMMILLAGTVCLAQSIESGKKLMYYGRWEGAEQNFENLITKEPSNLDAYYWLTEVLIEEKKVEEAKQLQKQLNDYLSSHSDVERGMLDKVREAELLLQAGDAAAAKLIFEELRKKTKEKNPEILIAIVRAWLHTKDSDYNNMLYLLDKAEKKDKNNPEIFSLRGDIYRRLSEGGKAVQAYQEALEKSPSFAEAAFKIGKIYLTQNNAEMFLKYFNQAIVKDPAYAPAYYELYYYYYFRDVNKAKEYLDQYIAHSDPSVENDYMVTDLLFASQKPNEAIEKASQLLQREGENAKPRLYKLIAYSYDAIGDSTQALSYMEQYFRKENDTNYVAKDFELLANLQSKFPGHEMEVIKNLELAIEKDTLIDNKAAYATKLVETFKKSGDKKNEAKWLGALYAWKENPTNLDLYYWGMAHYSAGEYDKADTVFKQYTEKYPEHVQGFYWRAKSNALIDSTMENGMAIPYYEKVIEMASVDSIKNKSLLVQSYGYLGAYQANVKKDFELALVNFDKILTLDPGNSDALKYRDILRKWVKAETDAETKAEARADTKAETQN